MTWGRFGGAGLGVYPPRVCVECAAPYKPVVPKQKACSEACSRARAKKVKLRRAAKETTP